MISAMREYFRSLKFILLIVIVAFIATSAVYFGASSMGGRGSQSGAVATVNGEDIPGERFRRAYANYVEFYRQIYKEPLTPEMAERLGISQQVIDGLVQETLVVQQAAREGMQATDEEVQARIVGIRAFQEQGRFSRDRYLAALRQARIDPGEFETEQRRDVQRRKIEAAVRDGIKVSDDEVKQAYVYRREKVRAAWASLELSPLLAQVSIADGDVEPYLKNHTAQFTRPERRRVQYVVISGKALADPVSEADAEAYYKEHPSEFEKPRRLRAAHVLVRVPPTGGSEAEQKSRAKVEDVIRRAKAGEDFAKLARAVSEDAATAAQGGDLGFVAKGEMVPQFEEALFALDKGQISAAPVRTTFGYHAIKVLDVQEGGRQPLKEVIGKIKEKLLAERSERAARAKAEEVKAPLMGAADFGAEAHKLGVDVRQATVARGDGLEGVGRDPQLEDSIFSLTVGGVSAPAKTASGYAIVKVLEQLPSGVPPLAEIKGQVIEAMKREKAETLAGERAKALVEAAAKGGDFGALARHDGFAVGETPLFSRAEPPQDQSALPGSVLVAALNTATGQISAPVRTPAGVYVVKGLERHSPDLAGFEGQRDELRRQVLEQKRSQAWESWVKKLRDSAKVDISPQYQPTGR